MKALSYFSAPLLQYIYLWHETYAFVIIRVACQVRTASTVLRFCGNLCYAVVFFQPALLYFFAPKQSRYKIAGYLYCISILCRSPTKIYCTRRDVTSRKKPCFLPTSIISSFLTIFVKVLYPLCLGISEPVFPHSQFFARILSIGKLAELKKSLLNGRAHTHCGSVRVEIRGMRI